MVLLLFLLFLHATQEFLNLGPMNTLKGKEFPDDEFQIQDVGVIDLF